MLDKALPRDYAQVRRIATAPGDLYIKELIRVRAKGLGRGEDNAKLILAGVMGQ
jgi:hypothetical protein